MCRGENTPKQSNSTFDLEAWQDGGISSFEQTCYADYWNDETTVPSISFSLAAKAPAITVDPYDFGHRMALGKCMILHTGSKSVWGEKHEKHWYWAYLAQLDWQGRSGRLSYSGPTTTVAGNSYGDMPYKTTEISTESWFGQMNLYFSVAAYTGAAKAKLVPSVKLDPSRRNAEEDPGFQICVEIWYQFWIGPHERYLSTMKTVPSKVEEREALIEVYRELWETHTRIVHAGVEHTKKEEAMLPEIERQFAMGWCHMVELFAAMGYTLLSLEALMKNGAGYLPSRVLVDDTTLEDLKRTRPDEFQQTQQILDLYHATPEQVESMCGFFRRLTRWESERQQMPVTLKTLNKGSAFAKTTLLLRILTKIVLPHPTKSTWMERSLVAAAAAATGAWYIKQNSD